MNLHGLSFLTMVLNVAVAVEMMEKLRGKNREGAAGAVVQAQILGLDDIKYFH